MTTEPLILYLPDIALEKIFSFLPYDEIAKNRVVSNFDLVHQIFFTCFQVIFITFSILLKPDDDKRNNIIIAFLL